MKKILGLIGSSRKLGNSEIMVKEISRHINLDHELSLVRLQDFDIQPCKGCYTCLIKGKGCKIADDFNRLLEIILDADAIIIAAPTYFLSVNSSLKRFLDRGLAFYSHIDELWKKPAVGVGIAGIEGKEGFTLLGIENFIRLLMLENKNSLIIYGPLPGEIFLNQQNKEIARSLAKDLFEPVQGKDIPCCPLCKSETFRFLNHNTIKCMLCSNNGTIAYENGKTVIHIDQSDHDIFLTKKNVMKHKQWLLNMKERFLSNKKQLKEITIAYLKEGEWIKPIKKEETL